MKYCKNCGVKIADDVRFCASCGFKNEIGVSGGDATPPPSAVVRQQEPQINIVRPENDKTASVVEDKARVLSVQKWEYLIVNILSPMWIDSLKRSGKIDGGIAPLLNQLGDEGWDLILGKVFLNLEEGETTTLTFKRPKK